MKGKSGRVLIISSDNSLLASSAVNLDTQYELEWATNEAMAQFLLREWDPDVILMDAQSQMFNLIRQVRTSASNKDVGVIVISRSSNTKKESVAFQCGADQFTVMPIQGASFLARVESLLRRVPKRDYQPMPTEASQPDNVSAIVSSNENSNNIEFHGIRIYPDEFMVKRENQLISISPIQVRLLHIFVTNSDQLLSRDFLKKTVWDDGEISPRSIDAQISKLKKVVPEIEAHLVNIYGKGYVLTGNTEDAA